MWSWRVPAAKAEEGRRGGKNVVFMRLLGVFERLAKGLKSLQNAGEMSPRCGGCVAKYGGGGGAVIAG